MAPAKNGRLMPANPDNAYLDCDDFAAAEDAMNEWDKWVRERQDEIGAFNPASTGPGDSNG